MLRRGRRLFYEVADNSPRDHPDDGKRRERHGHQKMSHEILLDDEQDHEGEENGNAVFHEYERVIAIGRPSAEPHEIHHEAAKKTKRRGYDHQPDEQIEEREYLRSRRKHTYEYQPVLLPNIVVTSTLTIFQAANITNIARMPQPALSRNRSQPFAEPLCAVVRTIPSK